MLTLIGLVNLVQVFLSLKAEARIVLDGARARLDVSFSAEVRHLWGLERRTSW